MNILVTGGCGFIGSHCCVALLEKGYSIIIADNLSNSKADVVDQIQAIAKKKVPFYQIDVTDSDLVSKLFLENQIDDVIHFAGLKAVGESVEDPLRYYYNNTVSTMVLAKACVKFRVLKFIFSSSATVYGENKVPFVETMPLMPTSNPYGETKRISERILSDTAIANPDFMVVNLRYFNPVGAHKSGLIGEAPLGTPNNLMPYITQVAKGKRDKLRVFGDDYSTPDGTGVRDYIHVMDLAEGHVAVLENMKSGAHVYNLGTGQGISVMEMVKTFERVNGVRIPFEVVPRRPGDIAVSYADPFKANRELGWKATRNLEDMCRDAWRFEKNYKEDEL